MIISRTKGVLAILLRRNICIAIFLIFLLLIFSARLDVPSWHESGLHRQPTTDTESLHPADRSAEDSLLSSKLPSEYHVSSKAQPYCSQRFGVEYLGTLSNSTSQHCSSASRSSLTCFHSQTHQTGRIDSFCIGGPTSLTNDHPRKLSLNCRLQEDGDVYGKATPRLSQFPSYWYETGPRLLFNRYIEISEKAMAPALSSASQRSFSILVTREEIVTNLWHTLMQIWSLYMTIDVLRVTADPRTRKTFFDDGDARNTQVIIFDKYEEGPFIELWQLFARKPILRWENVTTAQMEGQDIIVPLPGHSNPFWEGDWTVHECGKSDLLETFSSRILSHFNISTNLAGKRRPEDSSLILTYMLM